MTTSALAEALDLLRTALAEEAHARGCSGEFGYRCKCWLADAVALLESLETPPQKPWKDQPMTEMPEEELARLEAQVTAAGASARGGSIVLALIAGLRHARAERNAALAVLRHLEWSGGDAGGECPRCGGNASATAYRSRREHEPDCDLAQVLAKTPPA